MKTIFNLWVLIAITFMASSCAANFDSLVAEGKYKEAEECIKKMKGVEKYDCAEILINEYIESTSLSFLTITIPIEEIERVNVLGLSISKTMYSSII